MFTPHMTEEELQAAAYKDFLEMRIKVKIAFEQFIYRMRFTGGKRGVLHSLFEEKKVSTKSKNTWHVIFVNLGYTPQGEFMAGCFIYIPLYRGEEVDYLFINNLENFVLQKLSTHFLMRYKERYLESNGINLRGSHPALYYMLHNQDNTLTYYMPEKWTEKEMEEKGFMISQQGLSLVRFNKKLITYITFLDQENLSRYKAMVYEEEALWRDLSSSENPKLTLELKQALYMKHCRNPEKTKAILRRYLLRTSVREDMTEDVLENIWGYFEQIIEQTLAIDNLEKLEAAEAARCRLPDLGRYLKQIKRMHPFQIPSLRQ